MRHRIAACIFAVVISSLCLNSAYAGSIVYEFETILELETGADTLNLDGAVMHYEAVIAEGTSWESTDFGWDRFTIESYLWSVSGGSAIDGVYPGSGSGEFQLFVWTVGFGTPTLPVPGFTNNGIYQVTTSNTPTGLVTPDDFGGLRQSSPNWSTEDGSEYDWIRNGHFSFASPSSVPVPSTLLLLTVGLFTVRRNHRRR
jgi:hypothetical protein